MTAPGGSIRPEILQIQPMLDRENRQYSKIRIGRPLLPPTRRAGFSVRGASDVDEALRLARGGNSPISSAWTGCCPK
jgi:hypothetical protein